MLRTTILLFLIALSISSCNNSQNTNVNMTLNENKEAKQDSVSGYAPVNGLNMYYEIYGEGKPLVLIHGGGSTIQTSFGRIIPELSKNRRVIAVELQGHGHTADRDSPETFQQDADDVAALLKYLKIENADFFGFSNGGNTTMQIAIRHPGLVRRIILGSAFYKRDGMYPGFWESMKPATLKDMPQLYKDAYRKVAPDSNDLSKMFEKDKNRMVEFKDWDAADLHAIHAPTLIISGDKDVVRPEHAVEMYRLIPDCELAIIPGGHGKYMGEIMTLSNDSSDNVFIVPLIEEFLNKQNDKKEQGRTL
jgi:pimeloyl-ACP methyl ester carboxylesterase